MRLRVVERDDEITQIGLVGRFDAEGLRTVDRKLRDHVAARERPAIVDLSELVFIASLGIGMLVSCAVSLSRHDARMVLLAPHGVVEEALRAVRIDQLIPLAGSLAEAEAIVRR